MASGLYTRSPISKMIGDLVFVRGTMSFFLRKATMPSAYQSSHHKFNARTENVGIYRRLTGLSSIPADRGYWTLCNLQPASLDSEIEQMVASGLITKEQFHGIDKDKEIIIHNRATHPKAHWHHGDWTQIVLNSSAFNPSLVYLDTTSFADNHIGMNMVSATMMRCPAGTVMLANLMLNDPRSHRQFDENQILRNIERQVPSLELELWRHDIESYRYSATGKTFMITYVLYKP
jgi:hypothetical protein